MAQRPAGVIHANGASSLVDVIERILDKGVVIAGDIKLKIVDIELLTIQVRLLVCSVDKAREMGMNWWMTNAYVGTEQANDAGRLLDELGQRIQTLEAALGQLSPPNREND